MPLTRSASALVDQHIHPPHERSRNRKRSIEAHTPGPSKTTNYGAAPSTATISTTTLEPQINSQVSESHSLQVFAAHRQSSLYDEAIDANLFETLKKGLEDELEKAKGAGTGKRGSVGEDNGNRWVMAPTTWYLGKSIHNSRTPEARLRKYPRQMIHNVLNTVFYTRIHQNHLSLLPSDRGIFHVNPKLKRSL